MSKKYDTILFDLDGTLTDSARGIINAVIYALEKKGIAVDDKSQLSVFIGPPLLDSFQKYYGMTKEEAEESIQDTREYFVPKGMFENEVYAGIENVLNDLKNAGKTLIVATSKPEPFAEQILEHFNLRKYFAYVAGASMDNSRLSKEAVIRYALDKAGIEDKTKLVMVGDRKHDIIGAKACGLDSVGVLYGYGDLKELTDAGASYISETVEALKELLL